MPTANLTSRPKIAALKPPATGNIFYSHDGDALKGIRLAVGKTKKSWVLSKRIGGSVKSIILGEWPDLPNGLAAEAVAKDKLKELNAGTDAATTKVATLMDAFDSHLRESTAKAATVATYRLQIANHLDDIFALPIEKVTRDMLLERLKKVSGQKNKSGQPMASTAQHLATIIKMATARAAMIRDTRDIAHKLKAPVVADETPSEEKVKFDPREKWPALDRIFDCKSLVHRTAWLTMLFTGFRSINVVSLDWSQIDLTRKEIKLTKMKNGLSRTFPVADVVIEALKALPHREGYVFPADSKTGHIYSLAARTIIVGEGEDKSEVVVLRQHDCRRLFTTAARKERLPEYIINQMRGDADKKVQDGYDVGSMSHADANKVAARIITECEATPSIALERIKSGN